MISPSLSDTVPLISAPLVLLFVIEILPASVAIIPAKSKTFSVFVIVISPLNVCKAASKESSLSFFKLKPFDVTLILPLSLYIPPVIFV